MSASDEQRRGRTADLGDEGLELRGDGMTLLYPEGWDARLDGSTAVLTAAPPSTAFIMVQRLGMPLPESAREAVVETSRAGIVEGMVSGLDGPPRLVREEPMAATFLGAQREGEHLTYAGTFEGDDVTLDVDLFTAGLEADTVLLVVTSEEADRDEAVSAFALVTASLALT